MKRINLKNYGFIEAPELNFTDDGNRFICYTKPNAPHGMYVTKCTSHGCVYISIRIDNSGLPWEVCRTAPFYADLDMLNGVKPEELKDEDMYKFIDTWKAAMKYVEEYHHKGPTPEQRKLVAAAEAQRTISNYNYHSNPEHWTSMAAKIASNKKQIEELLKINAETEAKLNELKEKATAAKKLLKDIEAA